MPLGLAWEGGAAEQRQQRQSRGVRMGGRWFWGMVQTPRTQGVLGRVPRVALRRGFWARGLWRRALGGHLKGQGSLGTVSKSWLQESGASADGMGNSEWE